MVRKPREGWESAFAAMHAYGEDALLIDEDVDSDTIQYTSKEN